MYKTVVLWAEIFPMKDQKTNIFKGELGISLGIGICFGYSWFQMKENNSIHENEKS